MASLEKPKEVEKAKKAVEDRPTETEEEKKKRLRKESRRHLRVRWKPDANLVETKLFKHDHEEDTGFDANMRRDVADVNSEGRMLRMHKDLNLDDDDDVTGEETDLAAWSAPSGKLSSRP